jgi:hypothetical protein
MTAQRRVAKDNTFRHNGRRFYLPDTVDFRGQMVTVRLWSWAEDRYNQRAEVWGEHSFLHDNSDAIARTTEDDSPMKAYDDAHREEWAQQDDQDMWRFIERLARDFGSRI